MDSQRSENYKFPATLSNQERWFGLPTDEAIIFIPLILGAVFYSPYIFGPTLLGAFIGIRKLKNGKGSSYLIRLIYWFLPKSISKIFLLALPPSYFRYWIS